ncbi:phosphotransferase family protein [Actinomadura madurae]|nr:phosphotransferase family protein [Actinomadura madurae]MCP9955722.1 phosphotransferase family protein [Actinomadura madurae]MCQ0021164.1 phosphotransferase family protein [Actinomadura madurae]
MRRIRGECDYRVLRGELPLAWRKGLAERLCDLLAAVHAVDWRRLGLGELLPDPGAAAARFELDRWERILRRDQLESHPELELAIDWFRATAPAASRTALVHADFKPGNVLLEDGRITGLLDWELAHPGDPLEDLGWVTQPLRASEHTIPGVWESEDLLARYERVTGMPVHRESLAWWAAFAAFKTAVMQVSGLRSFLDGRSDKPFRPTRAVLGTLLAAVGEGRY